MTKSLDVQTYDDGQIERLKKQSMTSKRTDYEKKKKKISRKERLAKYITRQKQEMASMSATIQEPVFDEEVIPANEECNSQFCTEFFLK